MSTPQTNRKTFAHHAKLAMIPVLALVLAIVLYRNLSSSGVAVLRTPTAQSNDQPLAGGPRPESEKRIDRKRPPWPQVDLNEIVACDAFQPWPSPEPARPSSEPARKDAVPETGSRKKGNHDAAQNTASAGVTTKPQASNRGKLKAVFRDGTGAAAIVGSRVVRRGDVLEGGARVVEINAHGIVVELE
jgi:hypothetical protein